MTALAGGLAGGLAAGSMLFWCDPARVWIYPVCPFHQLTGLDCPGCGSLRALHALLHGDWLTALHFNLLLVVSLPLFAGLGLSWVSGRSRGGVAVKVRPFWLWVYVAAWILFGILRNLPFSFCAAFRP